MVDHIKGRTQYADHEWDCFKARGAGEVLCRERGSWGASNRSSKILPFLSLKIDKLQNLYLNREQKSKFLIYMNQLFFLLLES